MREFAVLDLPTPCLNRLPERMTAQQQRLPLGEHLIAAGLLTPVQLDLAHREQQRNGGRLAKILVQLGFVAPEVLAEFLGRQAGSQAVNLNRVKIDPTVLKLVPSDIAKRCLAMPISRKNGTLTIALADPFDVTAVDTIQQICGLSVDVVTAPERDILNCLELFYATGDTIGESIEKILDEKERQVGKSLDEVLGGLSNTDR